MKAECIGGVMAHGMKKGGKKNLSTCYMGNSFSRERVVCLSFVSNALKLMYPLLSLTNDNDGDSQQLWSLRSLKDKGIEKLLSTEVQEEYYTYRIIF